MSLQVDKANKKIVSDFIAIEKQGKLVLIFLHYIYIYI